MVDTAALLDPSVHPASPLDPGTRSWLLRGVRLADGTVADVAINGGRIAAVDGSLDHEPGAGVLDLDGFVLLPGLVEAHAHLDKALTADRVANPAGDLDGAIAAWMVARPGHTTEDITDRARRAILRLVSAGTTAIRTHADTGPDIGIRAVDALVALREELADIVTLQVVACAARPVAGSDGAAGRAVLDAALDAGADLIGGAPWLEADPGAALDHLLGRAADRGLPVDLHLDETLDPSSLVLGSLLDRLERRPGVRATASHVVSLGTHAPAVQRWIAERAAAVELGVVTLPLSNLFLQGRGRGTAQPRGLTAVRALLDAGALVAGGGDNLRDPFDPLGRGDPLEVAALLVAAAHLTIDEALHAVTDAARSVLGLPEVAVRPGSRADLVAIRATSLTDAIGGASDERWVFRGGRLVARTRVERTVATR